MEFLKNHYEKIILSIVLLLLAVAAGYAPLAVSNVRRSLEEAKLRIERRTVQPLEPPDLSTNQRIILRARHPQRFDFAADHNVFNPLRWIQDPQGKGIMPAEELGIKGLMVVNIRPLYRQIKFISVRETGSGIYYEVEVVNEAATDRVDRRPRNVLVAVGEKRLFFRLVEVKGDLKNPDALVFELDDRAQPVEVRLDKPFQELAGYAVDLEQKRANRRYRDLRPGDRVSVGNQFYTVVSVGPNEVTLEESQTRKRTTLIWQSA